MTHAVTDTAAMRAKRQKALRRRAISATTIPAAGASAAPPTPTHSNALPIPSHKAWREDSEKMPTPAQRAMGKASHHTVSPAITRPAVAGGAAGAAPAGALSSGPALRDDMSGS
jgi:hypothetical protein